MPTELMNKRAGITMPKGFEEPARQVKGKVETQEELHAAFIAEHGCTPKEYAERRRKEREMIDDS